MREAWTPATLGSIGRFEYGKALPERDRSGSGAPVVGSSGIVGYHETPLCTQDATIVVGRKGTAGSVQWVDEPCSPIDTTYWIRPLSSDVIYRFLCLLLEEVDLPSHTAETGVPGLNRERAESLLVKIPPLDEQRRIVDLIGSLDATITATDQAVTKAQQARHAVLTDLLSPPSSSAESTSAARKAAPSFGSDPGWTPTTLGEIATWHSGGTPKAGDPQFYSSTVEGYPWAVIADLAGGRVDETAGMLTAAGLAEIGGRLAPAGAVLVSMYGSIGKVAVAGREMATNQAIAWAEAHPDRVDSAFLALQVAHLGPAMAAIGRGATQKNINRQIIKLWPVTLPPLTEQRRIVEIVSTLDDEVLALKDTAKAARVARAGMLSDLLSGAHEIPASYDRLVYKG